MLADGSQVGRLEGLALARGLRRVVAEAAASLGESRDLPELATEDKALLVYTSGTTGRPKGVVVSHGNLAAQMACLEEAWAWRKDDLIVSVLPLHHVHGIVNVTLCAAWAGAACRVLPGFDAERVWQSIHEEKPTLFMAVPTIYRKLIEAHEAATARKRKYWSAAAGRLRLMVSGSAALPLPTFERWRELTGHVLLERYGMSEIGMALSNPLDGERRPGTVGQPLPGVEVRRVDGEGKTIDNDAEPAELEIRGPAVFRQYWQREQATREAFTRRRLLPHRRRRGDRRWLLAAARPVERRHPENRRREGFGDRDRGRVPQPSGHQGRRHRRPARRNLGPMRGRRGRARSRATSSTSKRCEPGPRSSSPPTRSRAGSWWSKACPATCSARSRSRRVAELF